jgi:putative transposase
MPSRMATRVARAAKAALPSTTNGPNDQHLTRPINAQAVQAVSVAFKKALIERALGEDLSQHLGHASRSAKQEDTTNLRNRVSAWTVLSEDGPVPIDVPRHRLGKFEPLLIP